MAKVNSKGIVSGKVGPVIYRRYRDMNLIQGRPRKFVQRQNSIRASAEFGLSSSAAAVIRRAFAPAYIHRDGTAVSRSTQLVYRCIRNSATGAVGQRDLHDGSLDELIGMDFNADSKLSQVLQVSHTVNKLDDGTLSVTLGAFNSRTAIKRPASMAKRGYKCRIRLMLVAFNFREEYLEYLDVKDIDFYNYKDIPEQTVQLKGTSDQSCIQILSMSLMLYDQMSHTGDNVLLNSRSFSPCSIIAAFQAEKPSPATADAANLFTATFQDRIERMAPMGYDGNEIMRKLKRRIPGEAERKFENRELPNGQLTRLNDKLDPELRRKISFKKT